LAFIIFWNFFILNTAKTKRWNGKIETLAAQYLNGVLEQMLAYGDRVQFALARGGQRPHYQVINVAEKKITFDGNHLITSDTDDFVTGTTSLVYSLEQIEAAKSGVAQKTGSTRARVAGGGTTRTTIAQKVALVDAEKYEYFKQNRSSLPADIAKHSQEITAFMMNGMSAEDAFAQALKSHA
jgi:hypothetical protein